MHYKLQDYLHVHIVMLRFLYEVGKMAKVDSKELLKRVKSKEKPERANATFRFNSKLMEQFKAVCDKQGVTPTAVLEEFMESFISDLKK
jgi:hypothetical protein